MKRCKICGAVFSARNYRQKICSDECRKRAIKRRNALRRTPKNKCILCGADTQGFICMGSKCRKIYHQVYSWTQQRAKNNIRASGEKYMNPPEKIQALKEKYKNGVSVEIIKQMKKIKSVDLIINANANKIVFSTGETLIKKKDTLSLNFETKKEENA